MSESIDPELEAEAELEAQADAEAEAHRRIEQGLCFECGAPEAGPVRFMRVMSFLRSTA